MTEKELWVEYMVARETIAEAEEFCDQLKSDYQMLRHYTEKLKSILDSNNISYPDILDDY